MANAPGAVLGAAVLSAGLGCTAPIRVGAVLALVGSGIAVVARTADRRERVPATGPAECRVAA